jgi:hypothetical protein
MNIDNRLALPVGLLLAVLEYSFARVGWAASASADVVAAARWRLLRATSGPRPSTRQEGIADVIVLSDERKHER